MNKAGPLIDDVSSTKRSRFATLEAVKAVAACLSIRPDVSSVSLSHCLQGGVILRFNSYIVSYV